jgi:hypothetical protein
VDAGGLGQYLRLVGEAGRRVGHPFGEDLPDLVAVVVDRRHQDVRRLVVVELDDQLGEVGLDRRDAGLFERLVELDLLGGHRLDLDHLVGAGRADQAGDGVAGLAGVAGPVHGRAGRRGRRLELEQQLRQLGHDRRLDGAAGEPELLPVRQLADDPGPLVADRVGGLAQVGPQLRVAQLVVGRGRERPGAAQVASAVHGRGHDSPPRISA